MLKKWIAPISLLLVLALLLPGGAVARESEDEEDLVRLYGLEDVEESSHDGYLVKVSPDADADTVSLYSTGADEVVDDLYQVDSLEEIADTWDTDEIEYIEPNFYVTLYGDAPNDFYYSLQWGFEEVGVSAIWDAGITADGVRVGIIDSGVVMGHNDLDYSYIAQGRNYETGGTDVSAATAHGTVITGILKATRNNFLGIAGMLDKAIIVPLRVFETAETSVVKIVAAIYDAVDVFDCDVINMSFGIAEEEWKLQSLKSAVSYAASKDVLMVAAVGNDGDSTMTYPAGWDEVVGVGSIDQGGGVSAYSQRNSSVFVTAPGSNQMSLTHDRTDAYSLYNSGTSYAAPYVTGMAAVAKAVKHDITVDEFKQLLIDSADDAGSPGYNTDYGYGIINVERFVDILPESNWVAGFRDITDHWAADSIVHVVDRGLFTGATSYAFDPSGSMSRAMFVTVLGRLYESAGGSIPDRADSFIDTENDYYTKYVAWATDNEIVEGYGGGTFGPNNSITREEAAVILHRFADYMDCDTTASVSALSQFEDSSSVSSWARQSMAWAVQQELINGVDTGVSAELQPDGISTRAQVATIMERFDLWLGDLTEDAAA